VLVDDLKIPRENVQEKAFNWDRNGKTERFSASIEVVKDFDKFSYMDLDIKLSGSVKPSEEFGKEGTVTIVLEGIVRTEYPQDTMWERSFIYEIFRSFYHKVFYQEKRKRWVSQCRDWMLYIQNEMKAFFNLLPKMGG